MEIEEANAPTRRDELSYRLKQQTLLAKFGRMALQAPDLGNLLQRATEICADGLEARYCKVLEYQSGRNLLLMQAGVGWDPDDIGSATLGADEESPAGYAYHTGESVLSNHLMEETRFRTPRLLAAYGIRRAINVLIDHGGRDREAFGILEVDSPDAGKFDEADVAFLAGCASILGVAIVRNQSDLRLQEAIERQALLTREMSHRIKNSLGVVASLLRVNAKQIDHPEARRAIGDAEARVLTVARVHDHLWRSSQVGTVDLRTFLEDLCESLSESTAGIGIACEAEAIVVDADNAIPVGLIVNELVTNALKYAYDPGEEGAIDVTLVDRGTAGVCLSVADHGKGLPVGFDVGARRGSFGLRVIASLVTQLDGVLTIEPVTKGTRFDVRFSPKRAI